jgi:hypothetical protein
MMTMEELWDEVESECSDCLSYEACNHHIHNFEGCLKLTNIEAAGEVELIDDDNQRNH